jgi:amino acid transporter
MLSDSSSPSATSDVFVLGLEVVLGLIVLAFLAYVVYRGVSASRNAENVALATLKAVAIGLPAVILAVGGILLLVALVAILVVVIVILAISGASNVQTNQAVGVILIGIALAMLLILWSVVYLFLMIVRRLVRGSQRRSLEPPG